MIQGPRPGSQNPKIAQDYRLAPCICMPADAAEEVLRGGNHAAELAGLGGLRGR
jgi:hypothetical protein